MKLTPDSGVSRQLVLLAPPRADTSGFAHVDVNRGLHTRLLEALQRLRALVYVDQGAVSPGQLQGGRHVQEADSTAWHIVSVDSDNQVSSCARYVVHRGPVSYPDLSISHSALALSDEWGQRLRLSVETELAGARRRDLAYVELGGWAIAAALRCTTEAVRIMCASYALFMCLGGALGVSTANRLCSAPLLRRIGGKPLAADGLELPPYFEPEYNCELEALRFDSSRPNPKYLSWIEAIRDSLMAMPVVAAAPGRTRAVITPVRNPARQAAAGA